MTNNVDSIRYTDACFFFITLLSYFVAMLYM